jgi:thioredoxin 1
MNEVIHIHDADFQQEVLNSPVPVLVDFSSVLCGPCNRLLPVLNELASDLGDSAKVVAVEVTMNERLAEQYGIASLPTLIVFRGGREIHRMIGLKSKEYLREALAA